MVLGRAGRNFAAGMTGGVAYVLDEHQIFDTLCNLDTVNIEGGIRPDEDTLLRSLVEKHVAWTGSPKALGLLEQWPEAAGHFVKVIPLEYERAMQRPETRPVIAMNADMIEEVVSGKA